MVEDVFYGIFEYIYGLFARFDSFGFNVENFEVYAPFVVSISSLIFLFVLFFTLYVLYKLLGGIFNVLR